MPRFANILKKRETDMKKKLMAAALGLMIVLSSSVTAMATEPGSGDTDPGISVLTPQEQEASLLSAEEEAEAISENTNIPYLALGADLTDSQKTTVLAYMGLTAADLPNYNVVYITNDMEHEALDGYIDSSIIGTKSLSSVMVKQTDAGTGIRVTTYNINYCTIAMYKNALVTAGVENADVVVAGPTSISGTAALIGAMRAYEEMSGKKLKGANKEVALDELITIGELTEGLSGEQLEQVQNLINEVKAQVIAGGITDPEEIRSIIEDALAKYGITFTEDQIKALTDLMAKIGKLDIDPAALLSQLGDLYNKYGATVLADAKTFIDNVVTDDVKQSFWQAIGTFFSSLWTNIVNAFA